jgi:hypothetical protein
MTASDIYHRALKSKENDPNFSKFLLESNDSVFCAYYASNVIRGPWEEASDIIKDHPYATLIYARDAIKGRWRKGEETILNNQILFIYQYARDVIRGRWEEGEEIIKKHPEFAYLYARDVIRGEWREGEDKISSNLKYSFLYSTKVSKKPFIKCKDLFSNEESYISKKTKERYKKFLINNGFTEWMI